MALYNLNSVAQVYNKYGEQFKMQDLKSFAEKALYYDERGDYNEAIKYKMREIQATEYIYGTMSEQFLMALQSTSIMCDKYNDSEAAIMISKQQGEIQAALWGKNNWDYATYLWLLGQFYSNARNYEMSINTFTESMNLFESLHINDNQYALTLSFIAQDYYRIGDNRNSLYYHKKCLNVRREIGDAAKYLNELNLMLLMSRNTDFVSRFEIINQEINNLPKCVDANSLEFVNIFKTIARKYWLLDDYTSALMYCEKALSIAENSALNRKEDLASVLGLKCKYLRLCGRCEDAIKVGERTQKLYESVNNKSVLYAELLYDMAWAYRDTYNYEKAIILQKEVAKIYEECKDWLSLAESYNSLGHLYYSSENLSSAKHYHNMALGVLDNHGDANKIIDEEIERTGNQYLKTTTALASISARIDYIKTSSYGSLARVCQKENKYIDAINIEKKNCAILKGMKDTRLYCEHLRVLSEYYRGIKKYPEATSCMEECLKITEIDDNNGLASTYTEFSLIDFEKGNIDDAIKYAEEAFSIYKNIDDIDGKNTAQYFLSYYYLKSHKADKAEKILSELLDSLKYRLANGMLQMTNEQKQRLWNRYEYCFLTYRIIAESSVQDDTLLSKLYDYVLFSKSLLLDTNIYKSDDKKSILSISWRDIQKKLSENDIAIEFVATIKENSNGHTYHALIIDNFSNSPRMITLYSESELKKLKENDSRNIRDIVGELIWKPILAQYTTVKNIYFSPDGILHMLPIEYYTADGMHSMFEHYNMYRLSSTKEIVWNTGNQQPISAVLYGGLDYNHINENASESNNSEVSSMWRGIADRGGFDPLFNTALETQEIKEILAAKNISTTLYSGENGTEESFRKLSGQDYSIIHLATHGMYISPDVVDTKKKESNFDFLESLASLNDPVKEDVTLTHSFIVMSGGNRVIARERVSDKSNDGILTAKEISQVDFSRLNLVVLSACESGRGDINYSGVYGLQRGFKKAGAHTILMSLDKVDDEATKILMVEFYRNLMDGKTKLQSLRNAQKHLRSVENGKYDNPKYWASFILLDGLNY